MTDSNPQADGRPAKRSGVSPSIMKFAGIGTQLGVAIALGVFGGLELDERMAWDQPIGTAIGGLVGLAAGLYLIVRALK